MVSRPPTPTTRAISLFPAERATVPSLIGDAGPAAAEAVLELALALDNPHTRSSYLHALHCFSRFCFAQGWALREVTPSRAALYIRYIQSTPQPSPRRGPDGQPLLKRWSKTTVAQHLSALRRIFAELVTAGVLPPRINPFATVRPPKQSDSEGRTPVMGEAQARAFMQWLPQQGILDLRDRAFIACMLYSFGRVSAIAGMRRRDWTMDGAQWALLLDEKGGKRRTIHAHHKITAAMHAYIEVGELEDADPESPLFRASNGRCRSLSERPFRRVQAWKMVKRRIAAFADERRAAGERLDLSRITCHSFRAIGITSYLNNDGRIEFAQRMAGHSSPRTTELYHHGTRHIALEEYERIRV